MLQWIEQAMQGDRKAFDRLVRHFTGMAYAVANEKLHDAHLAEDAVQEAFTEAFIHLRKLEEPNAFPGWLKMIVVRQCHRHLRRKKHRTIPLHEAGEKADNKPGIPEIVERKEMQELLHASVAALSPNMRIAVHMFYFYGYSLQEISDCLGMSASVWKKRLFDARRKLKGMLPVADFVSVFHHLYEGGAKVLHIVNGDSVADKLRQGVVQGDILVWREVYPEGPVFVNPAEHASRTLRAQYLEKAMGIPNEEFIRISEEQEKKLAEFHQYEEIVLWFEHDLFDQTMLGFLLHWFARQPLGRTKLSLLCIGAYPGIELFRGLGQLSVDQLKTLSGTWQQVRQEELELGKAFWEAYCSPDPGKLAELLQGDTGSLPFAHDAFQHHLSRFPSTYNGLGIVEQTTLEMAHSGLNTPLDLFKHVGDKLHWLGMGDLQYWHSLAKISQCPNPLLIIEGREAFPDFAQSSPSFLQCRVALTELGLDVLNGKTDWLSVNGADDWYGGVHLQGRSVPWRWDVSGQNLVPGF